MTFAQEAIASLRAGPLPTSAWIVAPMLVLGLLALLFYSSGSSDEPLSVPGWKGIPLLGNTIQYIIDNASFISRARLVLKANPPVTRG